MQCFHDYRFCPKISEEWAIDLNLSAPPPTKIWLPRLCGHIYIGETGRRLGDRFREHFSDIRNKRIEKSEVAKHFNLVGHNTENVNIVGLLHCSNTFQRKQCEAKLISKLGTLVPFVMNKE